MLERDNFAAALAMGTLWTSPPQRTTNAAVGAMPAAMSSRAATVRRSARHRSASLDVPPASFDPARIVHADRVSSPDDSFAGELLDTFQPGGAGRKCEIVSRHICGKTAPHSGIREAVHAIMTTPEYQLA